MFSKIKVPPQSNQIPQHITKQQMQYRKSEKNAQNDLGKFFIVMRLSSHLMSISYQ